MVMQETDAKREGPWIQTLSGGQWWPMAPRVEDVKVADLVVLAKICRFGGHCTGDTVYSVAEHSLRVAELLRRSGESASVQLCGLLHDAAEAYPPGDQMAPVLRGDHPWSLALRAMAGLAESVVREAYGLPLELPPAVRMADLVMLATEKRDLLKPTSHDWGELPLPMDNQRIGTMTPSIARLAFFDRMHWLYSKCTDNPARDRVFAELRTV